MGLFSRNEPEQNTQFGAPTFGGYGGNQYGMQQGGGYGMMDSMMGMQMTQNPMMQQMANDPVTATARLLELNDPVAQFITTQNLGLLMELVSEIVRLSIKEFFSSVKFTEKDGVISLDLSSMPPSLNTLSPENLGLTLSRLQSSAQQTISMNQQQRQMFLQAHTMGFNMQQQQQPGFFGSLLGGMLGNQVQQQGGFGSTATKVGAMGATML
jgi:hypothetical protein